MPRQTAPEKVGSAVVGTTNVAVETLGGHGQEVAESGSTKTESEGNE
jgi:hypothetical protein